METNKSCASYFLVLEGHPYPIIITQKTAKAILKDPTDGAYYAAFCERKLNKK